MLGPFVVTGINSIVEHTLPGGRGLFLPRPPHQTRTLPKRLRALLYLKRRGRVRGIIWGSAACGCPECACPACCLVNPVLRVPTFRLGSLGTGTWRIPGRSKAARFG